MKKHTDYTEREGLVSLILNKLHEYPSEERRLYNFKRELIATVEYFSIEQITEAIRSILSPTKAKDDTRGN